MHGVGGTALVSRWAGMRRRYSLNFHGLGIGLTLGVAQFCDGEGSHLWWLLPFSGLLDVLDRAPFVKAAWLHSSAQYIRFSSGGIHQSIYVYYVL